MLLNSWRLGKNTDIIYSEFWPAVFARPNLVDKIRSDADQFHIFFSKTLLHINPGFCSLVKRYWFDFGTFENILTNKGGIRTYSATRCQIVG